MWWTELTNRMDALGRGQRCPRLQAWGRGDALNRQEILTEGFGRDDGKCGFGQWPYEPLGRPTDEWKKIIRSLLLRHRLATQNLLIIKCTMSCE